MKYCRTALVLFLLGSASITAESQIAPICDVTCTPDPSGSTYGGAVAARLPADHGKSRWFWEARATIMSSQS
jgi:hypothetical protein